MKTTLSRNVKDRVRNFEIDLALAVACCLIRPGERLTHRAIGEITGMGHGGAFMIEQRALRKIREKLRYTAERGMWEELCA